MTGTGGAPPIGAPADFGPPLTAGADLSFVTVLFNFAPFAISPSRAPYGAINTDGLRCCTWHVHIPSPWLGRLPVLVDLPAVEVGVALISRLATDSSWHV